MKNARGAKRKKRSGGERLGDRGRSGQAIFLVTTYI